MSGVCSQCGGQVEIVSGGEVAYRCRCGVVGKWWLGDEDGPPMTTLDRYSLALSEHRGLTADYARLYRLALRLRLDEDGEAYGRQLGEMVEALHKATAWLQHGQRRAWRFHGRGDFGVHPLPLIGAAEVERALRGP